MKRFMVSIALTLFVLGTIASCKPKSSSKDGREAMQSDSVNVHQGEGEGEHGEALYR